MKVKIKERDSGKAIKRRWCKKKIMVYYFIFFEVNTIVFYFHRDEHKNVCLIKGKTVIMWGEG